MRILLYTQFCTPEPIFKSVPFARELMRRGHEVRILTGFPNYPGGKLYPGYRLSPFRREVLDGVPVLRVPLFPSHSPSALARMTNYMSFTLSSALPLLGGWKPDVVYVYNLVTIGAVAAMNRLLRGVPFVLDLQDIWPDSILSSGMAASWISRPVSKLCEITYANAALIVAQSPGFRRLLIERGVPAEKIEVVYNWYDEKSSREADDDLSRESLGFDGWFNILYAGNMGIVQALDAVVRAGEILAAKNERIRFVLMGSGVALEQLKEQARRVAPNHVMFLPACSSAKALAIQQKADALLVHLQKRSLFEITVPSKVQSYLASAKPILAGLQGDAANLILQARAGITAEPENSVSIAEAALKLARTSVGELQEMGKAGRAFFDAELTVRKGVARFEEIFERAFSERHNTSVSRNRLAAGSRTNPL
jgi:colanic acid biosynthesis glycosyl transferase WcaI